MDVDMEGLIHLNKSNATPVDLNTRHRIVLSFLSAMETVVRKWREKVDKGKTYISRKEFSFVFIFVVILGSLLLLTHISKSKMVTIFDDTYIQSLKNRTSSDLCGVNKTLTGPLHTKNNKTHSADDSDEIGMITRYHRKSLDLRAKFNCSLLFRGDFKEQKNAVAFLANHRNDKRLRQVSEFEATKMLRNCSYFRSIRGYRQTARTEEESNFPLAYVILMHKDFEQMERLVRALYQPQNVFCIHVDLKSNASLHQAVSAFASCFSNVYIASQGYNVTYKHVSRLLADIECMVDLAKLDHPWRYLTTMASSEVPVMTNRQKVDVFTMMNGTNDIREAYGIRIESRYKWVHKMHNGGLLSTKIPKSPPPHNITIVKGRAANAFSRAFVDWFYRDPMASDLLEWSMDTLTPDEHYWGTLNDLYHNPFLKTPGGYYGHPDTRRFHTVFANWVNSLNHAPNIFAPCPDPPDPRRRKPCCHGNVRHHLCLFGVLDLPVLGHVREMAANKILLGDDPIAYACMEELLETRETNGAPIDVKGYRQPLLRPRWEDEERERKKKNKKKKERERNKSEAYKQIHGKGKVNGTDVQHIKQGLLRPRSWEDEEREKKKMDREKKKKKERERNKTEAHKQIHAKENSTVAQHIKQGLLSPRSREDNDILKKKETERKTIEVNKKIHTNDNGTRSPDIKSNQGLYKEPLRSMQARYDPEKGEKKLVESDVDVKAGTQTVENEEARKDVATHKPPQPQSQRLPAIPTQKLNVTERPSHLQIERKSEGVNEQNEAQKIDDAKVEVKIPRKSFAKPEKQKNLERKDNGASQAHMRSNNHARENDDRLPQSLKSYKEPLPTPSFNNLEKQNSIKKRVEGKVQAQTESNNHARKNDVLLPQNVKPYEELSPTPTLNTLERQNSNKEKLERKLLKAANNYNGTEASDGYVVHETMPTTYRQIPLQPKTPPSNDLQKDRHNEDQVNITQEITENKRTPEVDSDYPPPPPPVRSKRQVWQNVDRQTLEETNRNRAPSQDESEEQESQSLDVDGVDVQQLPQTWVTDSENKVEENDEEEESEDDEGEGETVRHVDL